MQTCPPAGSSLGFLPAPARREPCFAAFICPQKYQWRFLQGSFSWPPGSGWGGSGLSAGSVGLSPFGASLLERGALAVQSGARLAFPCPSDRPQRWIPASPLQQPAANACQDSAISGLVLPPRARQDGEQFRLALEKAQREAKEREKKHHGQLAEQQELVREVKGRLLELLR